MSPVELLRWTRKSPSTRGLYYGRNKFPPGIIRLNCVITISNFIVDGGRSTTKSHVNETVRLGPGPRTDAIAPELFYAGAFYFVVGRLFTDSVRVPWKITDHLSTCLRLC